MIVEQYIEDREAWAAAHDGRLTASRFARVMNGGEKAWATLRDELSGDREEGGFGASSGAPPLRWGRTWEDDARRALAIAAGVTIDGRITLCIHGDLTEVACSPDGFARDESGAVLAGVELKCPYDVTEHELVRAFGLPEKYKPQVQGSLWVTGLTDWYFASYDPRARNASGEVTGDLAWSVVSCDEAYIQKLERRVVAFLSFCRGEGVGINNGGKDDADIPNLF